MGNLVERMAKLLRGCFAFSFKDMKKEDTSQSQTKFLRNKTLILCSSLLFLKPHTLLIKDLLICQITYSNLM